MSSKQKNVQVRFAHLAGMPALQLNCLLRSMAFDGLMGYEAAWFALQESENEDIGTREGLTRVKAINLTGKNRFTGTEEVIENNELGFQTL
jgi:hypothetical protein